jgi:large subunit ribosomal protein LP2
MDTVVAYQLLYKVRQRAPSFAEMKRLYELVNAEVDQKKVEDFLSRCEGKSLEDMVREGMSRMQSSAAPVSGGAPAGSTQSEAKKEEEKEEEESEEGFDLF